MIFIILKKSLPSNGANIIPERKRSKPYAYETSILLPNKRKIINYRFEMPKLNYIAICATIFMSKIIYSIIQIFLMLLLIFFRNHVIFFMPKKTLSYQNLNKKIPLVLMFQFVGNKFNFSK